MGDNSPWKELLIDILQYPPWFLWDSPFKAFRLADLNWCLSGNLFKICWLFCSKFFLLTFHLICSYEKGLSFVILGYFLQVDSCWCCILWIWLRCPRICRCLCQGHPLSWLDKHKCWGKKTNKFFISEALEWKLSILVTGIPGSRDLPVSRRPGKSRVSGVDLIHVLKNFLTSLYLIDSPVTPDAGESF